MYAILNFFEGISQSRTANVVAWSFFSLFLIPSALIVVSWNAVPGDNTYKIKTGLEKTLILASSPSRAWQGNIQTKITQRRADEFTQVLASNYGRSSLNQLDEQVITTATTIKQVKQTGSKAKLAESYIESLKKISLQLEEAKQVATANTTQQINPNPPTQPTQPTISNTNNTPAPAQSSPTTTTQPPVTEEDIEETQETIEEIIDELEIIQEEAAMSADGEGEYGDGDGDEEEDEESGENQGNENQNENAQSNPRQGDEKQNEKSENNHGGGRDKNEDKDKR